MRARARSAAGKVCEAQTRAVPRWSRSSGFDEVLDSGSLPDVGLQYFEHALVVGRAHHERLFQPKRTLGGHEDDVGALSLDIHVVEVVISEIGYHLGSGSPGGHPNRVAVGGDRDRGRTILRARRAPGRATLADDRSSDPFTADAVQHSRGVWCDSEVDCSLDLGCRGVHLATLSSHVCGSGCRWVLERTHLSWHSGHSARDRAVQPFAPRD